MMYPNNLELLYPEQHIIYYKLMVCTFTISQTACVMEIGRQ